MLAREKVLKLVVWASFAFLPFWVVLFALPFFGRPASLPALEPFRLPAFSVWADYIAQIVRFRQLALHRVSGLVVVVLLILLAIRFSRFNKHLKP